MQFIILIPARYQSTRLPGKPLCDIAGKTMIQRVYEQLHQKQPDIPCWVLTDDTRIYEHVKSWKGNVLMTDKKHQTGTERCAEGLSLLQKKGIQPDVVINVQGDEPLINFEQVKQLIDLFNQQPNIQIATLIKPIGNKNELQNPNRPKVVIDKQGKALYFSRQPIPFLQETASDKSFVGTQTTAEIGDKSFVGIQTTAEIGDKSFVGIQTTAEATADNAVVWITKHTYYKHIGMYAYKSDILLQIAQLTPTPLEKAEQLEQLRWIENQYTIHTQITTHETPAIDTPDDLQAVRKLFDQ